MGIKYLTELGSPKQRECFSEFREVKASIRECTTDKDIGTGLLEITVFQSVVKSGPTDPLNPAPDFCRVR